MELKPLYRCVAALDVHQAKLTVCVLNEDERGETHVELQEFGGFKQDRKAMAEWMASFHPQQVVMESTGIYWKSPYAALEKQGIIPLVVNARHVKQVPGRKTDIADAQWLAILARSGLLRVGVRSRLSRLKREAGFCKPDRKVYADFHPPVSGNVLLAIGLAANTRRGRAILRK